MYTIGQVLFVVLSNKNQVYPMQVVEVITKKSLKGEDVKYSLQAGSGSSTIMLDQVDGEIFDTAEKARKTLIQRATQQINKLVDNAIKKSNEWYKSSEKEQIVQMIEDLPDLSSRSTNDLQTHEESTSVILPDGTVAKVKLPSAI